MAWPRHPVRSRVRYRYNYGWSRIRVTVSRCKRNLASRQSPVTSEISLPRLQMKLKHLSMTVFRFSNACGWTCVIAADKLILQTFIWLQLFCRCTCRSSGSVNICSRKVLKLHRCITRQRFAGLQRVEIQSVRAFYFHPRDCRVFVKFFCWQKTNRGKRMNPTVVQYVMPILVRPGARVHSLQNSEGSWLQPSLYIDR